ncbi:MAG: DUF6701 domain-containing protein [Pseudomonas sp.]
MRQQGSISRHALLMTGRWTLLVVGLLLGNLAQAATDYFFHPSSKNLPAGCKKDDGHSYSCGVLTLGEGDTITLGKSDKSDKPDKLVTITFSGAFTTGASNLINASGAVDDLKLITNGVLTLGANTLLNANVVGTAAVNLGGASTLAGNLTTSSTTGIVTLAADSKVGGFISSQEGAINLGANSTVGGAVSAGAGVVTLGEDVKTGGPISTGAGAVTVGSKSTVGGSISTGAGVVALGAQVKVKGDVTTVAGAIAVGSQSTIDGAIESTGAGVVTLGAEVKVAAGISTQAGAVSIGAGSTIGASVRTQAGVVTLTTGIYVNGDISTVAGGITVGDQSRVCGSISSSGAGVVVLTTNIRVGGSVITQVGAITIGAGSSVGADVISGGVTTLTGLLVGGNVSSIGAGAITATTTSIGGNVSSGAGVITLTNSQVRGTVTSGVAIVKTGTSVGDTNLVINIPSACSTVVVGDIDHFEFSYAANALTCNPQPITVRACLDASCSSLFVDAVSLILSPSSAWTAIEPAALSGANTLLFTGGSAVAQLRSSNPGNLSLAVGSSSPVAKNAVACSTSGCTLNYADSGFIFDVPTLIAARPQANIGLSAVKKDDSSQACVPSFASVTRSLNFTSAYQNPATGTEPVWVNDSSVTSTPTTLNLAFNSDGRAQLTVRYDDAGQMILNASYSGSAATDDLGLVMTGADLFVSKPYGLLLQTDTDNACTLADSSCPVFPGGVRAGDPFSLRIKAVAWQSDGEAMTAAALADNPVTPNFRLSDIGLGRVLVGPVGGAAGTFSPTSYSHALDNQTQVLSTIGEVGVFRLSASPTANSYFGETVSGGESGLVGRFAPAYLDVAGSASLTPSCGSAFSYQGQPMRFAAGQAPRLQVSGHNRDGDVTTNYDRGDFWRLNAPQRSPYTSVTGVASFDQGYVVGPPVVPARLQEIGITQSVYLDDTTTVGDGIRIARWSDQQLWYLPAVTPTSEDLLFEARVSLNVPAAALRDTDLACYTHDNRDSGAACEGYFSDADPLKEPGFGGSEVRLGRLRIGNAHGSELQALNLSLNIETWQTTATGSGFVGEGMDNCSAGVLGDPVLDGFSGQLAAGETTPSVVGPSAGVGLLGLTAPGADNAGSVRVHFAGGPSPALPPTWLDYDWNGTGREAARGLATFGIYSADTPLVFRRELYR